MERVQVEFCWNMDSSSKLGGQIGFIEKIEEECRTDHKYVWEETEFEGKNSVNKVICMSMDQEETIEKANVKNTDNWKEKRKQYSESFSTLRRKRLQEKKRLEEKEMSEKEDQNIWSDLETIIKDNQMVLKGLEKYKVCVEITEKEEKIKQIQSKNTKKYKDNWFVPVNELEYNTETKLGQGKFGSVYPGTFRKTLPVAVKILRNKNGRKVKLVKDFLQEKQVMVKLKHPNLVQLYAVSRDEAGNDILVQERMENGSLIDYLQKLKEDVENVDCKETSFKSLLSWSVHIARGMAHLEKLKIVHRDLAARNVLLDENKTAKVADFGMAIKSSQTGEGCDYLPIRWAAPEAIFDRQFSSASDIWSFGITLWEIFTFGEKPFKALAIKEYKEKLKVDYETKQNNFRCDQPWQVRKATVKERKDIFRVMVKCWSINFKDRPKFSELEEGLHHFQLTGYLIDF